MDPEHPYVRLPRCNSVRELDGKLRLANTTQADEGHASGGLGTSLLDLVDNVSTVDEIEIAGEGYKRGRRRRCFRSFWGRLAGHPIRWHRATVTLRGGGWNSALIVPRLRPT